jgi:hypothetical protein
MLPEFPLLKEAFTRAAIRLLAERVKMHQGIVGTVNRARMFEGRQNIIVRPNGSEDAIAMNEGRAELRIPLDELAEVGLQQLMNRLDEIAKDIARQQSEHFFATLSEGSKKAGTTIDAEGKPLTPDLFLKMIETIWIDFSSDGTPKMPTMVISPSNQEGVRAMIHQMENSPDLKRRFDEIMVKKREEWNAREADRILVG